MRFDPTGKGLPYWEKCGDLKGCFAASDFLIPCKACHFKAIIGGSGQNRLLSLTSYIHSTILFKPKFNKPRIGRIFTALFVQPYCKTSID